jgi:hypothetical protein
VEDKTDAFGVKEIVRPERVGTEFHERLVDPPELPDEDVRIAVIARQVRAELPCQGKGEHNAEQRIRDDDAEVFADGLHVRGAGVVGRRDRDGRRCAPRARSRPPR